MFLARRARAALRRDLIAIVIFWLGCWRWLVGAAKNASKMLRFGAS